MTRGTEFLFDLDLTLTATSRASMQPQELTMRGARGGAKEDQAPGAGKISLGVSGDAEATLDTTSPTFMRCWPNASVTASPPWQSRVTACSRRSYERRKLDRSPPAQ